MTFVDGELLSTFTINNKQYEISKFDGVYILFEVSNSINQSNFSCQVSEQFNNINTLGSNVTTNVCVELAIEIDYYTRQTFSSDILAVNWALAILSGVSQLYEAQTNASISVSSIYVWNTTDPYAAYINDAGNMLDALANHWQTNNSGIPRELDHLLS